MKQTKEIRWEAPATEAVDVRELAVGDYLYADVMKHGEDGSIQMQTLVQRITDIVIQESGGFVHTDHHTYSFHINPNIHVYMSRVVQPEPTKYTKVVAARELTEGDRLVVLQAEIGRGYVYPRITRVGVNTYDDSELDEIICETTLFPAQYPVDREVAIVDEVAEKHGSVFMRELKKVTE